MVLMGIVVLVYVVFDGYDLGVGILLCCVDDVEKDIMIVLIGLFWDVNEIWFVFGVGLLFVVFFVVYGEILGVLYLLVVLMLFGFILCGVVFDFCVKVCVYYKLWWNCVFYVGFVIVIVV